MKKKYFFAVLFSILLTNLQAQIYDDMESYVDWACDGPLWLDCGGGSADYLLISTTQAHSGLQSGYINDGGVIDSVLLLGNKTTGEWYLEFWAYIPSGKMGYFNVQAKTPVIPSWCGEFYFDRDSTTDGAGEVVGQYETTFSFPKDEWFLIEMHWDITNGLPNATWDMHVSEENVVPLGTPYLDTNGDTPVGLGALNFFSASADCEFYVDDFGYDDQPLGIEDFNLIKIDAHPNPVTTLLTLTSEESIRSISIYNTIGQLIYSEELNALTTTVNMANYQTGMYFVSISNDSASQVINILKN